MIIRGDKWTQNYVIKPKVKIVFFDIDDTLRAKETGLIPESVKDVFHQLKEKGIRTGTATGRGIFGVVPEIMDLKPDFLVTLNGAYIEDTKGTVIYQSPINEAIVSSFCGLGQRIRD